MKKIGILTSGGDAPGMNAAIHAIVSTASFHNIQCIGFERGYNGLLDNQFVVLSEHNARHISHLGGTIIKSARCERMHDAAIRSLACDTINTNQLDGLIVIGGDGSFKGAHELTKLTNMPIVGIPGTIDNDIDGSDVTIGFDTATNTALDAIDKIRDTADAFERLFLVEVMGRHSGHLALNVGIAAEAEHIICPEMKLPPESIAHNITTHVSRHLKLRGNTSYIIVIAENTYPEGGEGLAKLLTEKIGIECRASILGHIQRGGLATCDDRVLATKLGGAAVESLLQGDNDIMIGEINNEIYKTPLNKTGLGLKMPNQYLLNLYQNKLEI